MASIARLSFLVVTVSWALTATFSAAPAAQTPAAPQAAAAPAPPPQVGIPITDQTVVKACAGCHRPDDKQQLSRISFRRTTPEGWERTITRMMALNGVKLDAPTARQVVKHLSNNLGLAPEEARPVRYEVERRLQDETVPKGIEGTCNSCHSAGRILTQRRTKPEWELLIAMHRGYYPIIDRQTYRRMGPAPTGRDDSGRPPDLRHPSEKAIDYLADAQPLMTKEWAEWSAAMRPARIEGTWALSGWRRSPAPPTSSPARSRTATRAAASR
jgi:quinohemoprotein amine dehydrogenase